MSERFQKTFISAREFLESWDKEIYEMTKLDYFIFLMVNQLGNQLEQRFFKRRGADFRLHLSFESLGTLCFTLGDSFEYFLDEDFDDKKHDIKSLENHLFGHNLDEEDERMLMDRAERIRLLLSEDVYFAGLISPVDLLHHTILDTLLQFYYEEKGIEFDEDDLDLIELAEFTVDVMIDFVRREESTLLLRLNESALDHFEELLSVEEDYKEGNEWQQRDDDYEFESEWENTTPYYEDIHQVIQKFVDDQSKNPSEDMGCVACDIELFEEYLSEHIGLNNVYEINHEHILEFMSVWLVKNFAQEREPHFSRIFQNLARFITWLANEYHIDLKKNFVQYYETVKTDVPRVVKALNEYLKSYNLFEILLIRDDDEHHQQSGFFEITKLNRSQDTSCNLINLQLTSNMENVELNARIFNRLKKGDILQATIVEIDDRWSILEIHYIFPNAAKPFVF
ncbi:MAG: hypothetical protein KDE57_00640 [Calditrichaeota bacterium]|nr:hypothetical protein [Calditrichota bacterium]